MNTKNNLLKSLKKVLLAYIQKQLMQQSSLNVPIEEKRTATSICPLNKNNNALEEPRLEVQLETFLTTHFHFRYNQLTDETEYRALNTNHEYEPVSLRFLNRICLEARKQGLNCWDRDIARYVQSDCIEAFHPFTSFLQQLPLWDRTDRVTPLAQRVSPSNWWVQAFHCWMRGMVAQWMGIPGLHAHSIAPLLISEEQGLCKSTFCKMLLPTALQDYYTDHFELRAESQAALKLTRFGLINLDEYDRYSAAKQSELKNLMQMATPNLRRPYQHSFHALPRIASFIGTSNHKDLLTDPTGSRRFICMQLEQPIDCQTPIDYPQLYAQLKTEIEEGMPTYFTHEEELVIMHHNDAFYKVPIAEEVFRTYFAPATKEEPNLLLTAAQLFQQLQKQNSAAMRGVQPKALSHILTRLGIERVHNENGNFYRVKKIVEKIAMQINSIECSKE